MSGDYITQAEAAGDELDATLSDLRHNVQQVTEKLDHYDLMQKYLRRFTDSLPDAVFFVNGGMEVIYVNAASTSLLSLPAEEILRNNFLELIGFEGGGINDLINKVYDQSKNNDFSYNPVHRSYSSGTITITDYADHKIHVSLVITKVRSVGAEDYYTVIMKNVTDLVNSREEAREEREKYKALSSASTEGVIIHNDNMIEEVNDSLLKILNYDEGEVVGADVLSLVSSEYKDIVKEHNTKAIDFPYNILALSKDGNKIPVEVHRSSIERKGENHAVLIFRDISEQRNMENQLRALKASFQDARDHVLMADSSGRILYVNNSFAFFYGYRDDQLVGTDIKELAKKSNFGYVWNKGIRDNLDNGIPTQENITVDNSKGNPVRLTVQITPIVNGLKKTPTYYMVFQKIRDDNDA